MYIYKELRARVDEVAYFGIPKDIDLDGILDDTPNKELCPLNPRLSKKVKEGCRPMEKTYFLQVRVTSSHYFSLLRTFGHRSRKKAET